MMCGGAQQHSRLSDDEIQILSSLQRLFFPAAESKVAELYHILNLTNEAFPVDSVCFVASCQTVLHGSVKHTWCSIRLRFNSQYSRVSEAPQ